MSKPVQRQRLWATWTWTLGKETQFLFDCGILEFQGFFRAPQWCFLLTVLWVRKKYLKSSVNSLYWKSLKCIALRAEGTKVAVLLQDKSNWRSKSSDPVNLVVRLRSTYVETLRCILFRWWGRVADRVRIPIDPQYWPTAYVDTLSSRRCL